MAESSMFTWSILFLLVFSFLISAYGISEMPILDVAYSNLIRPPEPIENISTIPFLSTPLYAGYLFYYSVMKVVQFVGLIVIFIIYGNTLTFGIPIIGLFITISTIFILFTLVKLFRGTS